MSTFICNTKTFSNIYSGLQVFYSPRYANSQVAIAQLLDHITAPYLDIDHNATLIAALYAINVEAVNQRYADAIEKNASSQIMQAMCVFQSAITVEQFMKSLECLHYQMSEGDIPEKSKLYILVGKLIASLRGDIAHSSELYNMATWG
jgi:hypothetical protein